MTAVAQSLRSVTHQGLDFLLKSRFVLIGAGVIALGILFGYLINTPESGELVVSIVVVLVILFIIINNPLNGVLVWLFFMVFLETWIVIPMGAGIPDLSFSRFVVAFLSISLLAMAAIGRFQFARISLADVCIVATTLGIMSAAPQSIYPTPKGVVQTGLSMHFIPLVIYFFAKNLVRSKEDLHKIFWIIALLGFVSGVYAAYEQLTGNILFVEKGKEIHDYQLYRGDTGVRLILGIWGGTHDLGRALAATIPITFYLFLERKKNDLIRILLMAMLIAEFYGIVAAMARSPWYALLIALFIMQIFYPQFRKLFFIIVLAAGLLLWITWNQVSQSQVVNRVNDKVSTLEGREARWQAGYNMWLAKPVRGWGFGHYEQESGRFRTDGGRKDFKAVENDYLYLLVAAGLIGVLPYFIFMLAPLISSLRLLFRARAPDWPGFIKPGTIAVYWAVLLCLLITSYTTIQIQASIKLMTFAVAGAVIGTHEHILRNKRTKLQ